MHEKTIHYFGMGKHSISREDREEIENKRPYELIVKCISSDCDGNSYVRLVKEYDDTYHVQDMGKIRK